MSSPPSGGPPPMAPTGVAAAEGPPAQPSGTRPIPGPRVRRAARLLPGSLFDSGRRARLRSVLRRLSALRLPAMSSALVAFALAGCGVLILDLVERQTGTVGLLVGMGLALLPQPFVLGALAWLNQTGRVPLRHALFCLAWGACAATTMAILVNGWASNFLIAHQGSATGETLGAEFATPLIEETAKAAALLMLLLPFGRRLRCRTERTCVVLARRASEPGRAPGLVHRTACRAGRIGGVIGLGPAGRRKPVAHRSSGAHPPVRARLRPLPYFRPVTHTKQRARSSPRTLAAGVVLGGITACGFAFTENALYLGRAFTDDQKARLDSIGLGETPSLRDFDGTLHTFILRALLSPFAHPLFTALTGLGIAITLTTGRRWLSRLAAPTGLLLAMVLHGVWNAAAGLGTDGFLLVYGLLMVPCFAMLVCFAVWARTRSSRQQPRTVVVKSWVG